MANPSKAKGTAAETAVVRYLRAHGFGGADRQPLRGHRDTGDIAVCPGLIVEVKRRSGPASLGQPPAGMLAQWLAQTEAERVNAGARHAALVVARAGTTDVGRWFAYVPVSMLAALLDASRAVAVDTEPVCLSVSTLVALLRAAGWGDPQEADA